MGYANDLLLRDCEAARKSGNIQAWKTLADLVLVSQKECAHLEKDRREADIGVSERRPCRVKWCARCSRVFR
jgi:hypothetical protein